MPTVINSRNPFSTLIESLRYGRDFLAVSQMRTLRNLSVMPERTVPTIIGDLTSNLIELRPYAIEILYCWHKMCKGTATVYTIDAIKQWSYIYERERSKLYQREDEYETFYDSEGDITPAGSKERVLQASGAGLSIG